MVTGCLSASPKIIFCRIDQCNLFFMAYNFVMWVKKVNQTKKTWGVQSLSVPQKFMMHKPVIANQYLLYMQHFQFLCCNNEVSHVSATRSRRSRSL